MADNSSRLDAAGVSETLASDDIAGVKYQRVKLTTGADGTAVDVIAPSDGAATSTVLPAGGMVYNAAAGTWNVQRVAIDNMPVNAMAGVSPVLFNETTSDRQRGNTEGTLLASAARTIQTDSSVITNYNGRGILVSLRVTAASGTGGLQVTILGRDPVDFGAYQINTTPTAVTTVSTFTYMIYPAASGGGLTQVTAVPLPRSWFARVLVGNASSYTYSLGYSVIV